MTAGEKQAETGGGTKQRADFTNNLFKHMRPYFVPFLKIQLGKFCFCFFYGGHVATVNTFM